MAVTLTTRPISGSSNWNAAGNPIVYKFTSTGHGALVNYRIEVECFRASDNTSLTGGIKFSYSPNSAGITLADVSAIVKSFVAAEWSNPAALNEAEYDTSLKFYIKYQELYDGSAVAVVSDVANPIHAVFSAMQIGSQYGGNLREFYPEDETKRWMVPFNMNQIRMWRDWPISVSFIHPDSSSLWIYRKQYNAAGILLQGTFDELDSAEDDAINRMEVFDGFFGLNAAAKSIKVQLAKKIQLLSDPNFVVGIGGDWSNVVDGTPNNPWTNDPTPFIKVSLDPTILYSQVAFQSLGELYPAGDYQVNITGLKSGDGPLKTVIKFYNGGVADPPAYDNDTPYTNSTAEYTFGVTAFNPFDGIGLQIRRVVGDTDQDVFFQQAELIQTIVASEELTINVEDVCEGDEDLEILKSKNPIHLFWKNSAGGDAHWNFPSYHEYSYVYNSGRKVKRVILFATDLTPLEWEYINELNAVGDVYSPVITELTSSVTSTAKRIGAQVYMLSEDGETKTGVIVIPASEMQRARDTKHSIAIEIELPETFTM